MSKRHVLVFLGLLTVAGGYVCYEKFMPARAAEDPPVETNIVAVDGDLASAGIKADGGRRQSNGPRGLPASGWEDSVLSGNMSMATYLIDSKSLRSDRAFDVLQSGRFEQLINHLRSEPSDRLLASEHTLFVGDVLQTTLDGSASATSYSCSDRICLISLKSGMDAAHFDQWKSNFAKQTDSLGKVVIHDTYTPQTGRPEHRIVLVTDPAVEGAGLEVTAFPVTVKSKEQGAEAGN